MKTSKTRQSFQPCLSSMNRADSEASSKPHAASFETGTENCAASRDLYRAVAPFESIQAPWTCGTALKGVAWGRRRDGSCINPCFVISSRGRLIEIAVVVAATAACWCAPFIAEYRVAIPAPQNFGTRSKTFGAASIFQAKRCYKLVRSSGLRKMAPYLNQKDSNGNVLRVGYTVDDHGQEKEPLHPSLPLLQHADLEDKVVLLRVDHNVVKKGKILDQYRIDVTLATMYNIIERGGRLVIMSHVGRPYDRKTNTLTIKQDEAVDAVVGYLQRKLRIKFAIPKFHVFEKEGIHDIDTSINWLIQDLRARKIGGIYLPNTRWFAGEEDKGEKMERLAVQLAALADVYVNDAFGSWQPHTSTYHVTKYLPSFAGLCMQDELSNVRAVLEPKRPFVAIVAGAKYDTKIGPLTAIYKRVDHLILGGLIYNTFLCAKYGVKIKGVEDSDIMLAKDLVDQDKNQGKILELPYVVESDTLEGRIEGKFRTVHIRDFKPGENYQFIVDVDPASFEPGTEVHRGLESAQTIFVNAVMGLMPSFWHGTSKMDETIDRNRTAQKFFGGGDTLQEFKSLHPGLYHAALDSPKYYMFTGGGTVLKVLEEANPFGLPTVKALISSGDAYGYQKWRAGCTSKI